MSILIKGMEMTKEYGPHEITITLFVRDDGTASLWGKEVFIPHEPLEVVPVPPHGDLIDRDALVKSDRMVGKLMMYGGEYVYTQAEIDRAPTIIPAEEGET